MAYSDVDELPTQVRNSLSREDQKHWMEAYNSSADRGVKEARRLAWEACKERPSSFSFSAYASVDDWDIQKEKVDIPSLLETMDRYIDSGAPISFNHGNYTVGNIWGYERAKKDGKDSVIIHGNLFGGDKGVYDEVRRKFMNGTRGFSVAGESKNADYTCDGNACGRVLKPREILEIALTPKPANPHALTIDFHEPSSKIAKSADDELKFTRMEMHLSELECPILKLRKALRDRGIEAHAREDGVFVPFARSSEELARIGLIGTPVEGGMILNERDEVIKSTFEKGFAKGILTEDGRFSDTDLRFFGKACDLGIVESKNGVFRLIDPLEAFEKANKAIEVMGREEGQKYLDTEQPPQKGLHMNYNVTDGPEEGLKESSFDPEKFQLYHDMAENERSSNWDPSWQPHGGYYESTLMPNKPMNHHSDAQREYDPYGETKEGVVTELYPDAPVLHIRNMKDWEDLFSNGQFDPQDFNGFKYIPSQDLLKHYDAIQFDMHPNNDHLSHAYSRPDKHEDDILHEKGVGTRDNPPWKQTRPDIFYPYTGKVNMRVIMNPYAVMNSHPYTEGKNVDGKPVKYQSPRTENYRPYDRQEALRKLKARYDAAGIPVNWGDAFTKTTDPIEDSYGAIDGPRYNGKRGALKVPNSYGGFEWKYPEELTPAQRQWLHKQVENKEQGNSTDQL